MLFYYCQTFCTPVFSRSAGVRYGPKMEFALQVMILNSYELQKLECLRSVRHLPGETQYCYGGKE